MLFVQFSLIVTSFPAIPGFMGMALGFSYHANSTPNELSNARSHIKILGTLHICM